MVETFYFTRKSALITSRMITRLRTCGAGLNVGQREQHETEYISRRLRVPANASDPRHVSDWRAARTSISGLRNVSKTRTFL
jgi:hypothetical protein